MNNGDKIKTIETSIREHRHTYQSTSNIYDQLRIKALALIAGEVAIITFLFNNWDISKLVFNVDRVIFLSVGILLLSAAFSIFLWIISTVHWVYPHDNRPAKKWTSDKNYETYYDFLEYLHDDYNTANMHCQKIVNNKCKKFNWSIFLLAGGVIILMVIKFGGTYL